MCNRYKSIKEWQELVHTLAKSKGWWKHYNKPFSIQVSNFHSEISEVWEEYRNGRKMDEIYISPGGKPEGIPIELADTVIRIMDTCERYGINLERAMRLKFAYNATRPYKHGGKKA